MDILKFILGSK